MAINFKQLADAQGGSIGLPRAVLHWRLAAAIVLAVLAAIGLINPVESATVSNVRITRHNLSTSNVFSGTPVKAQSETQICVFCHTPHGASTDVRPLWNRTTNASGTYTKYTSSSLDATTIRDALNGVTGGSSILCLSCHDGQIALGNVLVLEGAARSSASGTEDILLSNTAGVAGTAGATMPAGSGATTGYTRLLGTSLANDHPISITYDHNLAVADGELRDLEIGTQRYPSGTGTVIGIPSSGYKPLIPLAPTGTGNAGQVQCASCHDPHITNEKFLRLNRLQANAAPSGGSFSEANDIICLACHDKLNGTTWGQSAHASVTVADEAYVSGTPSPALTREFAAGTKVWQAACLNCHDTHTVQGARRLLREGTDATPAATLRLGGFKAGGNSAIEETCFQCHNTTSASILTLNALTSSDGVPDIKTEFSRARRMPIVNAEQGISGNGSEIHDVKDKDFLEAGNEGDQLGKTNKAYRHAECTDCHNPHRVTKNSLFNNQGSATQRTHSLGTATGNVASGPLRGTWGIEVQAMGAINAVWPQNPTSWRVVKGDPGASIDVSRSNTFLTREYQLCFKCHSNYSNADDTTVAYPNYPALGRTGGTPSGTNGMVRYTNVAAEFLSMNAADPPSTGTDQGEETNTGTACGGDCDPIPTGAAGSGPGAANNHRSWHPVVWPTGRDRAERGSASWNNLRLPYALADVGKLTMYCSDCHGSEVSWTQSATLAGAGGPNLVQVQGPHGSGNNFLLKGVWTTSVTPSNAAGSNSSGSICGRCHDPSGATSGFAGSSEASHSWEVKRTQYCMFCHIAVPHGWKNKAFLVNGNCIQSEAAGYGSTCTAYGGSNATTTINLPPYYNSAKLRINSWPRSRNWSASNCVSSDWMSSACGT